MEFLKSLGVLVLIIAVIIAAYYVTRLIANYSMRYQSVGGKHIRILESVALGKDRMLIVVNAFDKYYLLGSTPQSITLLQELPPDLIKETIPGLTSSTPSPLANLIQKKMRNFTSSNSSVTSEDITEENFNKGRSYHEVEKDVSWDLDQIYNRMSEKKGDFRGRNKEDEE